MNTEPQSSLSQSNQMITDEDRNPNNNLNSLGENKLPRVSRDTTQRNTTSDTTIIIQPIEASRAQFFSSSVKLFRILQNSPFQTANILQSRTNLNKGIQIVTIGNKSKLTDLLKITNLGGHEVKCYRSSPLVYKVGLIGRIEMDVTESEIVELLSELGYKNPKAERFVVGKGESARTTKTMKIWLNVDSLPEKVCLLYRSFPITPFIEKPWQCYKCQSFGHSARNCTKEEKCVVCAGSHNVKDCNQREGNVKKCANCGENHTASYGGCSKILQERKIQHIRAYQNLSYRDAAKKVKNDNPVLIDNGKKQDNIVITSNSEKNIKQTKEISTQTTIEKPDRTERNVISNENNSSNEKLAYCLLDLFMSMIKADSTARKCALISKAFSEHLDVTVSKEDLMTSFRGMQNRQPTPSPVIQTKSSIRKNGQSKI